MGNTFVVGKILKPKYGSLDLLCDALKCLDDLHVPPGSASRRRKHDSSLSELQLIALRLRIAEGFVEFDKEYDANYENSTDKSMKVPPLPSAVSRGIKCVASGESARIRNNNDIQNDKSKKRKRTSKEISNDDKQREEIEAQVALSPSQIKVGKFKKNPKGTRYSISSQYDDDDRYDFKKLWSRLKGKGWYWARPKNQFDDYWYIRPASIRPESEWIHGTDYFCTQDEVVAFVKERDNALSSDKISRSDDEIEDAPLKKMKKKTKKEKKKSISKKKMEKNKVG